MDEKGIQMGGGCKKSSKKYYYLKDQKQKYHISNDNLKLVTIIECISAAGDVVPPSFCLHNGSTPDLQHLDDELWGRLEFQFLVQFFRMYEWQVKQILFRVWMDRYQQL